MNVYFENKFNPNNFSMITGSKVPGYDLNRLISPFLHFGININTQHGQASFYISGHEDEFIEATVISGENIKQFKFQDDYDETDFLPIFFEQGSIAFDRPKKIRRALVTVYPIDNAEPVILNAIYLGNKMTIPNMVSAPAIEDGLFSSMERSFDGYALGYGRAILETISCGFANVDNNALRKIRNEYVLKVGNAMPHWIDLYPEADDKFSAVWGTLNANNIQYKKRAGRFPFYWDFELSWTEAK